MKYARVSILAIATVALGRYLLFGYLDPQGVTGGSQTVPKMWKFV